MKQLITLISPPSVASHDTEFYIGRKGGPPLNLAYLARVIDNLKLDYEVIDSLASDNFWVSPISNLSVIGMSYSEIIEKINPETTVIAISAMFTNEWQVVRELCQKLKVSFPNSLIVTGGEHVTAMAEEILRFEDTIDICFLGESELSFEIFLRKLGSEYIYETPGIAYRNSNNEIIKTPPTQRILDIDSLFPLWDKFDVDYYLSRKYSFSRIDVKSMPILATRGCPYKCTFCSNEQMWGTRYVMRSVDSIISEMEEHVTKRGAQHFDFLDLAASVHRSWFKELLEGLIDRLPNITWEMSVGTRSEILDREILSLMQKCGTKQLAYAPETGSRRMAKIINKRLNHDKMYESVKSAVSLGIEVKANTIIGFPGESLLDLFKTIYMGLKLGWYGAKGVSVFIFIPYPGSKMASDAMKEGAMSFEEYNSIIKYQSHNAAGARVFDIFQFAKYPRNQFYILISNITMVLSYFISVIRKPRYLKDLYLNIRNEAPQCPFEIAVYSILKKYGIVSGSKNV